MRPIGKKPSLRDTLMANQKALEGLCRLAGTEAPPPAVVMAPKRERAAAKPSEIPSEHQEQVAFVKWFRMQYPKVRIFAVPNAAMRSPQQAAWLKAEGMSAGCADLWIPEWRTAIEMKRQKGGTVSQEQQEWGDYLLNIGWRWHVCKGFDDARNVALGATNNAKVQRDSGDDSWAEILDNACETMEMSGLHAESSYKELKRLHAEMVGLKTHNAEVSGAGTASAGLPG